MKALTYGLQLLAANTTSDAETAASDIDFGSALVSFLYFLGALMLIYLVLVLVDKWGKKHPEKNDNKEKQEENKSEEQSDKDTENNKDSKDNTDNTDCKDSKDDTDNKDSAGEDNG
ncbi:MAG: hypothetical protein K2K41_04705 [Ruminiclostridium sp.]|nr:hypothetical protein [Ruminiclostridium sp.]